MRALIASTGSDGDVRPFFALAKGLAARGHDVRFAAADHYAPGAAHYGIPFEAVGPPWDAAVLETTFRKILSHASPLEHIKIVMDSIAEPERLALPRLMELAAESDVVIYPPIFVAAAAAARAKKVRHVSVQLAPVHPARSYSPTGANLGPLLNGLLWKAAGAAIRRASDAKLNAIVGEAGLPPWRDVLLRAASSSWLDLIAVSPEVIQLDPAWPAASRITGYFFLDEPDFDDAELESFIAGGAPPVIVGFGSMMGFDARAVTETVLEAVRTLDRNVIVLSGWAGLGGAAPLPHVRVAKFVPHGWLFPKAACVVHHGGAGTTAACLRAGVPQSIVWHLGDQPAWGKRMEKHGVAPPSLHYKKLTPKALRSRVDRMLSDAAMQTAAKRLGARISREDGVAVATAMIEDALTKPASA